MFVDTDNLSVENQIFSSLKRLAESYGFEFSSDGEITKGSIIRKKIGYLFNWLGQHTDPDEVMSKMKYAIQLAKIQKVQSEINKNNFEGAAAFISSTKDIPDLNIFLGSIAIVKRNGTQLDIIELSTDQMIFLENNPQLRNNPAKFWKEYQNSLIKTTVF